MKATLYKCSVALTIVLCALTIWLGLFVTPKDQVQGDYARFLYIHPALAWVSIYVAFGLAAISSILYLWKRTRSMVWDRLAVSSVEVGVVFTALTLLTGAMWGRVTWGVWWTWDARLTSTALLLVLFIGYLALRRVPAEPAIVAKRSAIAAIVAFVDVPIVHFSVLWWNTLHQGPTVLTPQLGNAKVHGSMAWTMLLSFVALTMAFVVMVIARYRIEQAGDAVRDAALDVAIAERRLEGVSS